MGNSRTRLRHWMLNIGCWMLGVLLLLLLTSARADEPFLQKNDVIALVGGEDMVVASEYGYLETLITRALPDYHLRFRSLAWEGDTVYEQRRDLNFPSWEEQLDKIGATVVICQFGLMESLDKKEKLPAFSAAYHALLQRFSAGGKRKIFIVGPTSFFTDTERAVPACDMQLPIAEAANQIPQVGRAPGMASSPAILRDGIHLSARGQANLAFIIAWGALHSTDKRSNISSFLGGQSSNSDDEKLRELIVAKNKLWFDYWRVQNWAFLAGDRTNQPSSRDWRDPSKRWFPAEREEFIPLIEAKEKEIDALVEKLANK